MEEKKYFFCYSVKLKFYLKNSGFRYEMSGNNAKTNKPYWVYIRSDKLNTALDGWGKLNNYPRS